MKLGILGATGRTGRLVVERALARGDAVRVLVRSPEKLAITHERLEIVRGDARSAADVAALVEGRDAIVSALASTKAEQDVCSTATGHVIAAKPRRYVVVSGANVEVPGDRKPLPARIGGFLLKRLRPDIFRDKNREYRLLVASDVAWTLVRPPLLTEGPATGRVKLDPVTTPGPRITRADLAEVVLRCVSDDALVGKAPFVAS